MLSSALLAVWDVVNWLRCNLQVLCANQSCRLNIFNFLAHKNKKTRSDFTSFQCVFCPCSQGFLRLKTAIQCGNFLFQANVRTCTASARILDTRLQLKSVCQQLSASNRKIDIFVFLSLLDVHFQNQICKQQKNIYIKRKNDHFRVQHIPNKHLIETHRPDGRLDPGKVSTLSGDFWPRQLVETAVGRKPIPSTGGVSTRILFLGPLPVFLFGISFVWSCCCLMECLPFCLVWLLFSLAVKCGWDVLPQCCAFMVTNSIRRHWKRSNLPWVPLKRQTNDTKNLTSSHLSCWNLQNRAYA